MVPSAVFDGIAVDVRRSGSVDMSKGDPANAAFIVRTSGRAVTRVIEGETLIVPIAGGVGDLEAIFTLNPIASRLWELLEHPVTRARLIEVILQEYDVSPDEAARDVAEFVDDLRAASLIESVTDGG